MAKHPSCTFFTFITSFSGGSSDSNPQLYGVKHSHAELSCPLLVFVKQAKSLYESKKLTDVPCVFSKNFAGITVMLLASPRIFVHSGLYDWSFQFE